MRRSLAVVLIVLATRVLTRASIEQMRTARLRKNSTDAEMGLGWHLRRVGGVMTAAHGSTPVAFYGPDRAVVTSGDQRGNPVEFIRRSDNTVGWVRVVGRIAKKD